MDARQASGGQYSRRGARSLGVESPLLLQFGIALFTGMVAATFVPAVRKAIPTPVEVLLWVALMVVCSLGLLSITDGNARNLTASLIWATDQVINTVISLLLGGVAGWIAANRLEIATWFAVLGGADVFALLVLRSMRASRASQPRVRLREWMELPVPAGPAHARGRATSRPLRAINRRLAAAAMVLGAATLAGMVDASIWIRNVMLPREARRLSRAARAGRVGSRARLESMREAVAHLQFAAQSWYAAAGEPAVSGMAGGLAVKANEAVRTARRGLRPAALRPGQVIDIHALLSAQSIGWYGPLSTGPSQPPMGEHDATEQSQTERLAS